jgi:hypothetical protein
MTQQLEPPQESVADQKKRLLAQCAAYRSGIGQARSVVQANLGAETLAKTAFTQLTHSAQAAFSNFSPLLQLKNLTGANVQALLPLVVSGVSLLARRSLIKPILRGSVFSRKKNKDRQIPSQSGR